MRRSVYCTASFSICSLRRAKFPIIYPSFGSTTKLQHIPPAPFPAQRQHHRVKRKYHQHDDKAAKTNDGAHEQESKKQQINPVSRDSNPKSCSRSSE